MGTAAKLASPRRMLAVRATDQERAILSGAASREHRSLSSFMLRAALAAAQPQTPRPRTPQEVDAAIDRAQALMRPYRVPSQSLVDTLIAERRAEAARD